MHLHLSTMGVHGPWRLEEGVESLGTGVTDCCELPCGCWEWKVGPLESALGRSHLGRSAFTCSAATLALGLNSCSSCLRSQLGITGLHPRAWLRSAGNQPRTTCFVGKGHLWRGSGTWEMEPVNEETKVSCNGHEPQTVHTLSVKPGLMSEVFLSHTVTKTS